MARKTLILEDAKIMFRNFSGQKFGSGARDFAVKIDPADVDRLLDDEWPVKIYERADEEGKPVDDPIPFIKAKVKYGQFPPAIYMVTSGGPTLLDEVTVDELDNAEIEYIDCILTQSAWEVNGRTGIAAYVKEMYVTIVESNFAQKYGVHHNDR